jgi:hypothetical protein
MAVAVEASAWGQRALKAEEIRFHSGVEIGLASVE